MVNGSGIYLSHAGSFLRWADDKSTLLPVNGSASDCVADVSTCETWA